MGLSIRTVGTALALHMANLGSIPSIPYSSLSPTKNDLGAQSQDSVLSIDQSVDPRADCRICKQGVWDQPPTLSTELGAVPEHHQVCPPAPQREKKNKKQFPRSVPKFHRVGQWLTKLEPGLGFGSPKFESRTPTHNQQSPPNLSGAVAQQKQREILPGEHSQRRSINVK